MNLGVYSPRRHALVVAVLCVLTLSRAQADRVQGDSEAGRTFDEVWRTVRDKFYDPAMHGVDWQAAGARYRPEALRAHGSKEFAAVVNRMLGELRASHLGYYTPDDFEYYFLPSVFSGPQTAEPCDQIGVMGTEHAGTYEVAAVLEGSPAAKAGVQGGDRLLEVEGRPFSTVGAFRGRAGRSVDLSVDRPGRGRLTLRVTPERAPPRQAFLNATERSARVIQRGSRRIGYVHLWCMTDRAFEETLQRILLGTLADTDGMVLDLRDGFGGHPFGYTDAFYVPDVLWADRPRNARGRAERAHHTSYSRPVAVLINEGTRSAKEFVAYQFRRSGRGTLVGTETAGAFLGAGGFPIGKVGYLEVPIDDITLDGTRLEGRGVKPQVEVPDTGSYAPGDPQIERAVDVVLGQIGR